MKIDIKEIFKSDLDPNSPAWWSTPKLDKINYNFYQLTNGGMPGPDGSIGPDGDFGQIGMTGAQGLRGDTGYQGPQGISADTDWLYFPHDEQTPGYLFPKKINSNSVQYSPIPLRIGIKNDDYQRYSVPAGYSDCVVLSNVNSTGSQGSIKSNLRISYDGKISDFKVDENRNLHIGKFISSDTKFSIIQNVTKSNIKTCDSSGNVYLAHNMDHNTATVEEIGVNSNAILSNNNSAKTLSNDTFIYSVDANENYVLSSNNIAGNVSWRKKREVFPSFPVGSIISIQESDLNNTYFYLNETITQQPVNGVLPVLNVRWGRGKENTQYAGWYVCNGKEWKSGDLNSISYIVPNLTSYNYSIASNNAGQHTVSVSGSDYPVIIGGSNILITASQSDGIYNIGYGNTIPNESDETSIILTGNNGGTNNIQVNRMIHIVYLERNDLIWQDPGV